MKIVAGDEKWVLYCNYTKKPQWRQADSDPLPVAKLDLFPKKVMLSIWWDYLGPLYWEPLPKNQTGNKEVCAGQLNKL